MDRVRKEDVGENVFVLVLVIKDVKGAAMQSVEDLDVFKLAHQLALKVYRMTTGFPKNEIFNLVSQTRRASSVGINLMEGSI